MATVKTLKPTTLPSFPRGDTPLLVFGPVKVGAVSADLTGYTGYFTLNKTLNPITNADAFLHVTLQTSVGDTLGLGFNAYFYYQLTNNQTENLDPTVTYNWDVQINKNPSVTNNFTIFKGTFTPDVDISRGLN